MVIISMLKNRREKNFLSEKRALLAKIVSDMEASPMAHFPPRLGQPDAFSHTALSVRVLHDIIEANPKAAKDIIDSRELTVSHEIQSKYIQATRKQWKQYCDIDSKETKRLTRRVARAFESASR